MAKKRGYRDLTDDEKIYFQEYDEFDEEWEKFIFRACQNSSYLRSRSSSISSIFNIMKGIILYDSHKSSPETENSGILSAEDEDTIVKAITNGLGIASVTGLKSAEDQDEKSTYNRIRYETLEDFDASIEPPLRKSFNLFKSIKSRFDNLFGENRIKYEYSKNKVSIKIARNKSYQTNLARIKLRCYGKLNITDFKGVAHILDASNKDIKESVWNEYLIYFNQHSEDSIPMTSDEVSEQYEQNVQPECVEKE